MSKFYRSPTFQWLMGLVILAIGYLYTCAESRGELKQWRLSVTEDLVDVKDDMATVTQDISQLKADVRWIRDGKHFDVATISNTSDAE